MSTISDAVSKKRSEGDEPPREARSPRVVHVEVPKDHTARNMLLAGLVAAVVLTGVFVGGYFVLARMRASEPRPATEPASGTVTQPSGGNEQTGPTSGDATAESGLPKLQGIFPDRVDPIALINGRRVRPGGLVDGYTLKAIGDNRVTLERDGRQYELVLE
ncbi:MAG: hypothetical protein JW889_04375 [Verrucomicrobia bacterium]|nr:hypothetical protein [Verrucomicrobiota bacterium]